MTDTSNIAKGLRELATYAYQQARHPDISRPAFDALEHLYRELTAKSAALEARPAYTEEECRKVLAAIYTERGNHIHDEVVRRHLALDSVADQLAIAAMMRLTRPSNGDRDAVLEEAAITADNNACDCGCAGAIRALIKQENGE